MKFKQYLIALALVALGATSCFAAWGGGFGVPTGNDGSVQYNDSNAFGGDNYLYWNKNSKRLGIGNNSPSATLEVTGTLMTSGLATLNSLSVTGNSTVEGLWLNTLTAGRIPYIGTAGIISDSATLLYDSITDTTTANNLVLNGNLTVHGTETVVNSTTMNVTVEAINPGPTIGTALSFNPLAGWTADYLEAKDSSGNTLVEIDNSGNIHSTANITADATVSGLSVTDGTATLTGGVLTGLNSLTSGTVTASNYVGPLLTTAEANTLYDLKNTATSEVDNHEIAYDHTYLLAPFTTAEANTLYDLVGTATSETTNHLAAFDHDYLLAPFTTAEANTLYDLVGTATSEVVNALIIGNASTTLYGDGANITGVGGGASTTEANTWTGVNTFEAGVAVGTTEVITNISTGSYTPTFTNIANIASFTAGTGMWTRIGNVVTFSGAVSVDPTSAATGSAWYCTIPIVSDFALSSDASGVASTNSTGYGSAAIYADETSERVVFSTKIESAAEATWTYSITYLVK